MQGQNRVGQKLGNYRLVKLLGKGGYSEVYLAENIHLGVQTAIKVLKSRDLDDLEQEKFRSEAKFMTTLEHPRIIKVLDYGIEMGQQTDGSTPYIVMEYAPRGTLRHLYHHHTTMPLQKIALYTKQVAEALQYAHDKNIIHQDVKPENILVRKEDDAALSDFGIAVAGLNTSNLDIQKEEIRQKMLRGEPLSIHGTSAYLAPERLQGHTQRASDQYSLAIVVYEWLAGKRPFEGSDLEIYVKHEKEPPPPLTRAYSYISPEVEQVVMKALAKSPTDRYKSVREFATALDNAIQASQQSLRPRPPMPNTASAGLPTGPLPSQSAPPPSYMPPQSAPPSSYLPPTPSPMPPRQSALGGQQTVFPGNGAPGSSQQPDPLSWQWQPKSSFGYTEPTVTNYSPGRAQARPQEKEDFPAFLEALVRDPATKTREILVTDRFFLQKQRTRMFFYIGILANILSALLVLVAWGLPYSILPAIIGGALSVVLFWRCTVSVKKWVAISFGAGVALWWGIAAMLVFYRNPLLAFLGFVLALGISLVIHIGYVYTRLQQ